MNKYIALERYAHHFYPIKDDEFEDLRYLVEFLSTDYRMYDQSFIEKPLSFYNCSFIYHDFASHTMYVGFSEWEIRTEIPVPCDSTFHDFVNSSNSCKINLDNFHEFITTWLAIKRSGKSFAVVYRTMHDSILCQDFDSIEEQNLFIANL